MLNTKHKNIIDIFIDVVFFIILALISPMGDFSAIPFIFLVLFRTGNKKSSIVIISILSISLCFGFIINDWSLQNTFALIALYGFMGFKYYYIIHIPTHQLKQENTSLLKENGILKTRLSIAGNIAPLTDDQILQKYPYMYFKETDRKKDPDPYRKIKDLRLLADDKGHIEIAIINKISSQTQHREFAKLKKEFKIELNRDKKIDTLWGLVVAGQELGIIPVRYRQSEPIL